MRSRSCRSQQLHGSFVALVTHLVMKSCYDVRPKGAGHDQLLEDATSLVCLSAIKNPVPRKQMWILLHQRPHRTFLTDHAGHAAMTGPLIGSCVCSSCRSAMDNLRRISVVAALSVSSALSAGCTELSLSPETSA